MERTFDRLEQFDERSRAYPILALIASDAQPRSYTWRCDTYNDQGREGACVGFSLSHELAARPKVVPTGPDVATAIYRRAQQLDPWPGEDYEGTSVLAGVKAVQEMKNQWGNAYIREYRWAFGVDDLILAVGYKGPAVLGVNWYSDMFDTDADGFLRVSGSHVGGHAILCNGFKVVKTNSALPISWDNLDRDKSYFKLHNSWGPDWGVAGVGKVTVNDMNRLLSERGEACIPLVRSFA